MEKGFDGGNGTAKNLGDLLVGQALEPAEENGGALGLRQLPDGSVDAVVEFAFGGGAGRVFGAGVRQFAGDGGGVVRIGEGVEGLSAMAGAAAVFVENDVVGDGKQPSGEFGGGLIAAGGAEHLEENALGEVFGFPRVTDGTVDDVNDGALVAFNQDAKGVLIAVADAGHEGGVVNLRMVHQWQSVVQSGAECNAGCD
jgi:hypothetical protein